MMKSFGEKVFLMAGIDLTGVAFSAEISCVRRGMFGETGMFRIGARFLVWYVELEVLL